MSTVTVDAGSLIAPSSGSRPVTANRPETSKPAGCRARRRRPFATTDSYRSRVSSGVARPMGNGTGALPCRASRSVATRRERRRPPVVDGLDATGNRDRLVPGPGGTVYRPPSVRRSMTDGSANDRRGSRDQPRESDLRRRGDRPRKGSRARRADDALLTGDAGYTDDVSVPGTTSLEFVRSRHARARIEGVETAAAGSAQGPPPPGRRPDRVGRDGAGSTGPVDRHPVGELPRRRTRPRPPDARRARSRRRREDPGTPGADDRQCRRLRARLGAGPAHLLRPPALEPVPDPGRPLRDDERLHHHGAGPLVPRRGSPGGDLRHRAARRPRGAGARDRPGRAPPPEPPRPGRVPLRDADGRDLRQRRLRARARRGARGRRGRSPRHSGRRVRRRALPRRRRRLLRRVDGRRVRERRRPRSPRRERDGLGGHALARAGPRDDVRPDRRRRTGRAGRGDRRRRGRHRPGPDWDGDVREPEHGRRRERGRRERARGAREGAAGRRRPARGRRGRRRLRRPRSRGGRRRSTW